MDKQPLFPNSRGTQLELGLPELSPSQAVQSGHVCEPRSPQPPLLPPFSLLSKCDGSPAGSRLARPDVRRRHAQGRARRASCRTRAHRPLPPQTRPRPAADNRSAHRHEARGGGDEHADDHPLAAPGRTVCCCGLWTGADAEAELG